jgi:Serine/threonine protein kinase
MNYCLNPFCRNPQNSDSTIVCLSCQKTILLDNRYLPISFLGGGGQGRNYLAIDEKTPTKKRCVIKQFCPHPNIVNDPNNLQKATELFNREATLLDQLGDESPQIPRLLAHLPQEGFLYLVQEFIDGENLLQELDQKGSFSEWEINEFLHDILPVLKFIHKKGVIHRDIKPENIMRRKDGLLVLIDFGLSKDLSQTVMAVGTIGGTMGYAPQEQLLYGEAYFASDLYALGATCIHLLTGIPPHQLYNPMKKCWLWQDILTQRGISVSNNLSQCLDKMLKIDVSKRYQSVDEVLEILQPVKTVVVGVVNKPKQNILNKLFNVFGVYPSLKCIQTLDINLDKKNSNSYQKTPNKIEFHPDGQSLAISYHTGIDLWNWRTGNLITTYKGGHYFALHPNGKMIATIDRAFDHKINILETDTGNQIKTLTLGHYGYLGSGVYSLVISPDSKLIVTVISGTFVLDQDNLLYNGKYIVIWNIQSEEKVYYLGCHYLLDSSCLSFTPDSQIMASSGRDGLINLWDMKTGNLIRTIKDSTWNLELLKKVGITLNKTISFNPQGNILASGGWDNVIKFWNPKNGQLIKTLSGHQEAINSLAFSPDGQLLASGSNDNTIKIWDVSTGEILYDLTEHTGFVNCVAFSPDGQVLATASNDQTIKIWQLN